MSSTKERSFGQRPLIGPIPENVSPSPIEALSLAFIEFNEVFEDLLKASVTNSILLISRPSCVELPKT